MLESDLERRLVAHCLSRGLLTYKFTSPAHRGVPDRIICGGGKVLFLELKAPGKKIGRLQQREIERLRSAGLFANWADDLTSAKQIVHEVFDEESLPV